ncbi:MAG: iron-sulfur cluster repair di-iron protein [Bryobacteraceae bacterium]|nr:iron-sulfur cluster repair di-iron protein [Bryobacteraceae bacterium]
MTTTELHTVGDFAAASLGAVRVLEKNGIDYCCGGRRTLEEVCAEQGLDASEVRKQLEQAITAEPSPQRDWATASLRELISHIVSTHHEYLKLELPRLKQRLQKVLNAHGDKDPETLQALSRVFLGLWQELDQHMHKEEMILFPAIDRCEQASRNGAPLPPSPFGSIANPIAVMEREHDSAGQALHQMKELTGGYTLPEYACATYRALNDGLQELEADLHLHIHLENNILFPRVIEMEKARR